MKDKRFHKCGKTEIYCWTCCIFLQTSQAVAHQITNFFLDCYSLCSIGTVYELHDFDMLIRSRLTGNAQYCSFGEKRKQNWKICHTDFPILYSLQTVFLQRDPEKISLGMSDSNGPLSTTIWFNKKEATPATPDKA